MSFINSIMSLLGGGTQHELPQNAPAPLPSAKKVLIVEDEAMLASAIESKLTAAGYSVFKATNGKEGLDMAIANKPDIVLCDILMPVMTGKAMLHQLRAMPEFKTLPVVMLTNAGDADNQRETTFYDNANAFLIKSNVSLDDVLTQVKTLIG